MREEQSIYALAREDGHWFYNTAADKWMTPDEFEAYCAARLGCGPQFLHWTPRDPHEALAEQVLALNTQIKSIETLAAKLGATTVAELDALLVGRGGAEEARQVHTLQVGRFESSPPLPNQP